MLERLRLELRDTTITYTTIPRQSSKEPVSFVLTEIDEAGFFVFSNPENDDPEQIRYLLLGNREMQVETIGKRNGREVRSLRRCPMCGNGTRALSRMSCAASG